MEKVFEIGAWIYGLAIISNANFIRIKKQHKIRSKKMLTYFGKHNEIGMDFYTSRCYNSYWKYQ